MNKQKITIWGRNFNLPIEYTGFPDENMTEEQRIAVDKLIDSMNDLTDSSGVEKYILKENGDDVGGKIDNIFKYVIPTALFAPIQRSKRIIAILCDYRCDEEHGIAVVFENEKFKKVCPQDDVL